MLECHTFIYTSAICFLCHPDLDIHSFCRLLWSRPFYSSWRTTLYHCYFYTISHSCASRVCSINLHCASILIHYKIVIQNYHNARYRWKLVAASNMSFIQTALPLNSSYELPWRTVSHENRIRYIAFTSPNSSLFHSSLLVLNTLLQRLIFFTLTLVLF